MMTLTTWKLAIAALAIIFLLPGCGTVSGTLDAVKVKAAGVADRFLIDGEWTVCEASSIGSVRRRYGKTVESANTYNDFCDSKHKVFGPR